MVPAGWTGPVTLDASYSIEGDLIDKTGLAAQANLTFSYPSASAQIGSFFNAQITTFPDQTVPILSANPVYLYQPAAFSLDGFSDVSQTYTIPVVPIDASGGGSAQQLRLIRKRFMLPARFTGLLIRNKGILLCR